MRFRLLLMLALATPALGAPGSPASSKSFEGWTAACNNRGACVIIGTAQEDLFYLRIARAAGAQATPEVKIVLVTQDPLKGSAPTFHMTAVEAGKSTDLPPVAATVAPDDERTLAGRIEPGVPSLAFIDAARNADRLDYGVLTAKGTLSLKGLSAALRYVDAQQGRAGTPTALIARGMTPIGQVPEPREPPTVVAAGGDIREIAKPAPSKALMDVARPGCDPDALAVQADVQAWRLGPDRVLFALPCAQGAYNTGVALYVTDEKGRSPKPVSLPKPSGGGADDNIVVNMAFDPKTKELSSFDKGRGLGDCGTATSWLWTDRGFALLTASGLDACPGALPDDWPNLYSAVKRTQR